MEKTMSISTQLGSDRQDGSAGTVRHLFGKLSLGLQRLGDRYRSATGLQQLESMSDWQLRDIGFDRCQIRHGISEPKVLRHHAD
jgi:hypothetical protein